MQDKWNGVRFMHFMYWAGDENYGGATVAYKYEEAEDLTYYAVAYCHPKDRFVKSYGRAKAAGYLAQLFANPSKFDGDYTSDETPRQWVWVGKPDLNEVAEDMEVYGYDPR